jgi:hypothetical protein
MNDTNDMTRQVTKLALNECEFQRHSRGTHLFFTRHSYSFQFRRLIIGKKIKLLSSALTNEQFALVILNN